MTGNRQGQQRLCATDGWEQVEKERYPHSIRIIEYNSLQRDDISPNARAICVNRESVPTRHHIHNNVLPKLEEACANLGIERIGTFPFTVSGKVAALAEDLALFNAEDESAFFDPWGYFDDLTFSIHKGLLETPKGETLYVFFLTKSRLLRPLGYDYETNPMQSIGEADWKVMTRWLNFCFADRVKDIVFVVLESGTPNEDRGTETRVGMQASGNMGGRPRRLPDNSALKREAIKLATTSKMNVTRAYQLLEEKYGRMPIKLRAFQLWLEKHTAILPGRPMGSKKVNCPGSSSRKKVSK